MITNTVARKLLRAEYALLRTPVSLLERRLVAHAVADDSTLRLTLERGLSTLDKALARLLGDAGDRVEPAVETPRAENLPTDQPQPGERPIATATSSEADRERDSDPLPKDEVERVADELRTALDEAPLAGELADADNHDKQRMADLRAKHMVEEYEEQQRAKKAQDTEVS